MDKADRADKEATSEVKAVPEKEVTSADRADQTDKAETSADRADRTDKEVTSADRADQTGKADRAD